MLDGLLSVRLRDPLFLHWPVDPAVLTDRLPAGVDLDTHNGRAWLGLVALVLADARPRGVPFGRTFPQVNLRTYVRGHDGTPAVYFLSLDAGDAVGAILARRLLRLPYYWASASVHRHGNEVILRCRRNNDDVPEARLDVRYGPTPDSDLSVAEPGSLPHFLIERYRFYNHATDGAGPLYYGDIDHPPWELTEGQADVRTNTMLAAGGFADPNEDPLVHYSPGTTTTVGAIRWTLAADAAGSTE